MKRNIFLVSYDYTSCVKVAKQLADYFDLRFFDWRELFEFDHVPRKLEEVIQSNGEEYVRKKLQSICKMESEFDDAVFACDLAVAKGIESIGEKIKANNYVIFLKKDDVLTQINLKEKFENSEINNFFGNSKELLNDWSKKIAEELSDFVIDIDGMNINQILEKIIKKLKSLIKN